MPTTARRLVPILALILVLAYPGAGLAQTRQPNATFNNIERTLKPGHTVVVENVGGERVKGEVVAVSGTELTVEFSRSFEPVSRLTYTPANTRSVVHRDSLLNGTLIGLGAGAASAVGFVRWQCGPPGFDKECSAIATLVGVGFVPIGAGLGVLVDFLVRKTVYRHAGDMTVDVTPMLSRGRTGVNVTLRF